MLFNSLNILLQIPNWLEQLLVPILIALGTGIAGLITYGFTRLNAWINMKIGNEKLAEALHRVSEVVQAAVSTINQTFVDELKKEGKFDKEAQKQALEDALNLSYKLINDETKKLLEEVYGDLRAYLTTLIENIIAHFK